MQLQHCGRNLLRLKLPGNYDQVALRAFSTSARCKAETKNKPTANVSPRWLSDTRSRIGKCITFGLRPELVERAGHILREISENWRELVAGSEGFLTDPRRAGLHQHAIVWGEEDSMGHVNNVMYVRYAESGRTNWTRKIGQHFDVANRQNWANTLSNKGVGLILKSIKVDFKFPMTWPDRISVYHKLRYQPHESTDSMILDVLILSEGKQRAAAKCLEDVVLYDYRLGKKTTLPPFMLKQFQQIWDLQEAAKRDNYDRLQALEAQVRYLEVESWDQPNAKEDLGSSA